MNILVLIAGMADPKWPLPVPMDITTLMAQRKAYPLLSPFDEAALELALKLRDADATVQITALVNTSALDDALLRTVAALRVDAVRAVPACDTPWDARACASALAQAAGALERAPDLVLIGREFGDFDDGSVPAAVAEQLGWAFVAQGLAVSAVEGAWRVRRSQGAVQVSVDGPRPLVVSVSNEARNRLRHPLLKNVMTAKKMRFEWQALAAPTRSATLLLAAVTAAEAPVRAVQCRMLVGDVDQQAQALADLLVAEAMA